jgi:hypothetical protein
MVAAKETRQRRDLRSKKRAFRRHGSRNNTLIAASSINAARKAVTRKKPTDIVGLVFRRGSVPS